MARGDHVFVSGNLHGIPYQHHGIDMGDGTVIHLAPLEGARVAIRDDTHRFSVRRDKLQVFSGGRAVEVRRHPNGRPAEAVASEAEQHLGRTGYNLLEGNCEHFAAQCATGQARSHQVDMAEATVSAIASMATKAVWSLSARIGTRLAVRSATKVHPAAMIADGIEVAVLAIGCQSGLDATRAKRAARLSSTIAAAGIGGLLGGPAGVAIGLSTHVGSTALADRFCKSVRSVCT